MKKMTFAPKIGGSRTFQNDGERLIADIVLAIPSVSEDFYTLEGKPRDSALQAVMCESITEGQRDQAFAIFKKEQGELVKKKKPVPAIEAKKDDLKND